MEKLLIYKNILIKKSKKSSEKQN